MENSAAAVPISLKGRALRLLSGREYSRAELERRLAPFEVQAGTLTNALDELQAKGYICEQRVVESVVHRRAAKLGTARIRQELVSKGLEPDAVAQAVQALRATEVERARAVWAKKFATPATTPADRLKQMRFLASRGFGGDAIAQVLRGNPNDEI